MKVVILLLLLASSASAFEICVSNGDEAVAVGDTFIRSAASGDTLRAAEVLAKSYYEPHSSYAQVKLKALRVAEKVHLYGSLDSLSLERVYSAESPRAESPLSQIYIFYVDQSEGDYYLGFVFRKVPDRACMALAQVTSSKSRKGLLNKTRQKFFEEDIPSGSIFDKLTK